MNIALPQTGYSTYAITLNDFLQPADERKIRALFDNLTTAWATKNSTAFIACFTEDSDMVNQSGNHYKRSNSNNAHQKLFESLHSNTRLYVDIKSIRFINTEMAVVHAETTKMEAWQKDINSCQLAYNSTILIKENGTWKITSIHNSRKEKTGITERIRKWIFPGK